MACTANNIASVIICHQSTISVSTHSNTACIKHDLTSSEPVCLECFAKVDGSFTCPRCQFPLCGEQCVGKRLHKAECEIFANLEKKINFSNLKEKHPVYTTIAPLRCNYYCSS